MPRCRDGATLAYPIETSWSRMGALALKAGMLAFAAGLWLTAPASAQELAIIQPGSMAVSAFSGTVVPGVDPGDDAFIDPERATLRIFDVSTLGASGPLVDTPPPFEVLAGQVGQVFGLAFDDGVRNDTPSGVPDLYAAATSLYGIRIVTADADDDGRPERQRHGTAGATFMAGQFGAENGGGPGTIWRVDGLTGAVTKFADIATNSGPGIGDVAFDKAHRQFFASDLDTGLIHRIDASGAVIDSFDHGVAGRARGGLAAIADDGRAMAITAPAFDSEDPKSWGYTQDERRIWAVAYERARLYYGVGDKGEIWSVGLDGDGKFAGDARRELTVDAASGHAVTDIVFDQTGDIYLARRAGADLLRYSRDGSGTWVPAFATGAGAADAGQTAGGVALQYGYDTEGRIDRTACFGTVAVTRAAMTAGGDGVRLTPSGNGAGGSRLVGFGATGAGGQAGDVAVWHPCEGNAVASGQAREAESGGAVAAAPVANAPAETTRQPAVGLQVEQTGDTRCQVGKPCSFEIKITNPGATPFDGPIRFGDAIGAEGIGRLEGVSITSIEPPLDCAQAPAKLPLSCIGGGGGLGGGGSSTHKLTVVIAAAAVGGAGSTIAAQNCFAAVPPDTPVQGLGGGGAPGGPGGAGPFACHRFTIDIPKGTAQCKLLAGQIRTKDGRCICPRGTRLVERKCVPAKPPACKVSGQVRGKSGACGCPRGTQAIGGACRKPPQPCPQGTSSVRGRCVPNDPGAACIAGEILVNGQCMIVERLCPRGTVGAYPDCRPARRSLFGGHVPSDRPERPETPDRPSRDPNGNGSTPGGPNGNGSTPGGSTGP